MGNIFDELDLHRLTIDEAIPLVDKYLEDSYLAGRHRVWIVHGKGTGVLRQAVREHLGRHKLVESWTRADAQHGADGATQVNIVK